MRDVAIPRLLVTAGLAAAVTAGCATPVTGQAEPAAQAVRSASAPEPGPESAPVPEPTTAAVPREVPDDGPDEVVPTEVVEQEAPPVDDVVALPQGQVPDVLVGEWSGGEGGASGEYLLVSPDGSYARGKDGSDPYSVGVIVASGAEFTAFDIEGQQEPGQFEYTDAAGIEVLGVYFGQHYYSYVRV